MLLPGDVFKSDQFDNTVIVAVDFTNGRVFSQLRARNAWDNYESQTENREYDYTAEVLSQKQRRSRGTRRRPRRYNTTHHYLDIGRLIGDIPLSR